MPLSAQWHEAETQEKLMPLSSAPRHAVEAKKKLMPFSAQWHEAEAINSTKKVARVRSSSNVAGRNGRQGHYAPSDCAALPLVDGNPVVKPPCSGSSWKGYCWFAFAVPAALVVSAHGALVRAHRSLARCMRVAANAAERVIDEAPQRPFEDEDLNTPMIWLTDLFIACVAAACTGVVFAFTVNYGVDWGMSTTSTYLDGWELGTRCVYAQGFVRWASLASPIFLVVQIDEVLDSRFRSLIQVAF